MEKMQLPENIENHIREKLQELADDNHIPENFGYALEPEVEEIPHQSYDGFIPFTNGGYRMMLMSDLATVNGTGYGPSNEHVRDSIEETIADSLQDAVNSFVEDNREALLEHFSGEEIENNDVNYHSLYDKGLGEMAEDLSELEQEWLNEGGQFWYQFQAMFYSADNARNESGEDEALFLAGVNLDCYGRPKGLELTYQNNVKVSNLTIEAIDAIISEMVESI